MNSEEAHSKEPELTT